MSDDKITDLKNALERFTNTYNELKSIHMNQDILEIYIAAKTKLSRKQVKAILKSQDEFFENIIINATVDEL